MKIFIILLLGTFGCNTQNEGNSFSDVAKTTVQRVFRYSVQEKYDSLKLIMSSNFLIKSDDDYLKGYFRDIRKVANVDGIPDVSQLNLDTSEQNIKNEFAIKFIPKSADSLNVDSIKFSFIRTIGFEKVWVMEVFNNPKMFDKIKTIGTNPN